MSLIPFNGADPSRISAALQQCYGSECVVVLQFASAAQSSWEGDDNWQLLQQVLSQPSVYEAFGISTLPLRCGFGSAIGLEVIGTLANLLHCGAAHGRVVDDVDAALAESRRYCDAFYLRRYDGGARAYSTQIAWCDWFVRDGYFNHTVLLNNGGFWALFAVTGDD
jgi:hypothetical protein